MPIFTKKEHDQTKFAQVAPILDTSLEQVELERKKASEALKPKQVWFKRPKVILLFVFSLVGLFTILILLLNNLPAVNVPVTISPSPTPRYQALDTDLSAQISRTKSELKALNFQEESLAFPQIDAQVFITVRQ